MDTQHLPGKEPAGPMMPPLGAPVARRRGGRWKSMRAEARRRRFVANAIVVGTTGAVVALAASSITS
jgi:hypothetical protein